MTTKVKPTVEKWKSELHNSEYWHNIYLMVSGCEIIDPDGWDRTNYEVSWYQEKITWAEFQKRAMISTQWTLPLDKRYEKIFSFLSHSVQEAKAERDREWTEELWDFATNQCNSFDLIGHNHCNKCGGLSCFLNTKVSPTPELTDQEGEV